MGAIGMLRELKKLTTALEFYADMGNWAVKLPNGVTSLPKPESECAKDCGKRARIALGIEVEVTK